MIKKSEVLSFKTDNKIFSTNIWQLEDQISNKDVSNQNGMVSMYYAMRQKKNNPATNEKEAENQMLLEMPDKDAKKGDDEKAFTPVLLKSVVKGNQYAK